MATRANLIATYNANPTLQSRYTLPQYLDMFGFGQTTTPTPDPDPTPTPTPEVPGIPNIINQNLGGGGDGPQGDYGAFGNLDKSTRKEFNIDGKIVEGFKNVNTGLYQDYDGLNIQNLGIGSFGIAPMIANALGLDDGETKYPGLFDKVSPSALRKNPGLFKSFFDRQDVAKQQKLQAEIDAANKAAAEQARLDAAYQQQTKLQREAGGGQGGQFDGATSKQEYDRNPTGFSGSFQDGGRVYLYNRLK